MTIRRVIAAVALSLCAWPAVLQAAVPRSEADTLPRRSPGSASRCRCTEPCAASSNTSPTSTKGRFQVRNARFSLSGNLLPMVAYKAEIDLSDEGSIKMLDAYVRLAMLRRSLNFTIGQMRVPFTIDAHRSPPRTIFRQPLVHCQAGGQRPRRRGDARLDLRPCGARNARSGYFQRLGADRPEGFLDRPVQLFGQGAGPLCRTGAALGQCAEDPSRSGRYHDVRRRGLLRLRRVAR